MTVQRTHLDYLNDIVQAMEKVAEFLHGMDFEAFRQDDKTIYAVIRALEVIGEHQSEGCVANSDRRYC